MWDFIKSKAFVREVQDDKVCLFPSIYSKLEAISWVRIKSWVSQLRRALIEAMLTVRIWCSSKCHMHDATGDDMVLDLAAETG